MRLKMFMSTVTRSTCSYHFNTVVFLWSSRGIVCCLNFLWNGECWRVIFFAVFFSCESVRTLSTCALVVVATNGLERNFSILSNIYLMNGDAWWIFDGVNSIELRIRHSEICNGFPRLTYQSWVKHSRERVLPRMAYGMHVLVCPETESSADEWT